MRQRRPPRQRLSLRPRRQRYCRLNSPRARLLDLSGKQTRVAQVVIVGLKVLIRRLMRRQRRRLLSHYLTRAHQALQHHRRISQMSMVLAKPSQQLFVLLTPRVRQCYWTQRSVFYSYSFLRSFAGAYFRMIVTVYRRMGRRHH